MLRPALIPPLAAGPSAAGFGVSTLIGLLMLMEAGIPIPIPADLLMILLGERAAAGVLPLWVAAVALELAALVGLTFLFVMAKGPGRAIAVRFGRRIGLTEARLSKAGSLIARRGIGAVVIGRATPGLRTVTVLAAAVSKLSPARAFVGLMLGATIFVQGHLILGYAVGDLAREVIKRASGVLLIVVGILIVGGVLVWLLRRGRGGAQAWSEAGCPACLAIGLLEKPEAS
jgi:membrane protein DedA with SNARE-associated domain